jgi:hypothetical protein
MLTFHKHLPSLLAAEPELLTVFFSTVIRKAGLAKKQEISYFLGRRETLGNKIDS